MNVNTNTTSNTKFQTSGLAKSQTTNAQTMCTAHTAKIDFISLLTPGIYEIVNKINGKRYIGETTHLIERIGRHLFNLNQGTNECLSLQQDWTFEKERNNIINTFDINILEIDTDIVRDKKLRKEREMKYISQLDSTAVYNTIGVKKNTNTRKVVIIYGKEYPSKLAAAITLGCSESTIGRLTRNEKLKDCYVKEELSYGLSSCKVDDIEYPSIKALVENGIAPNSNYASRRLRSPNHPNWEYITISRPHRIDESIGRIPIRGKRCIVDGREYPSVQEICNVGLATSRGSATHRLNSSTFPGWQWLETITD